METKGRILLVDDDKALADSVTVVLESRGYEVAHASDGDQGLKIVGSTEIDAVLTDFRMPGMGGMELLKKLRESNPRIPIILATAFGTTNLAINATKYGAFEYLTKPFEMPELLETIERAITANRVKNIPINMGEACDATQEAIVGQSKPMQEVFRDIGRIAAKPVTVMIQGETGTGKELIARAIFQHSDRSDKPFVAVNCAAIPENLLESELFGHEKGSFTGAVARRIGRFEQANHGTLFLDEIGDLPAQTQVKLLRVLQERVITRVGSKEEIQIDVRVLCATHHNLQKAIGIGEFREDLYYRLNSAILNLPPLRKRQGDIPLLVNYFLNKYSVEFDTARSPIDEDALEILKTDSWPGNVRQLENVIKRAVIVANGFAITSTHIRDCLNPINADDRAPSASTQETSFALYVQRQIEAAKNGEVSDVYDRLVDTLEREVFTHSLELAQGNQSKMSRWLGLSRLTVREKLDKFQLLPKRNAQ